MKNRHKEMADIFRAFSDENRLMILELLQSGELCACDLLNNLKISQSTLSHHMKLLCDAGVVSGRKEGKWVYYSIDRDGSKRALASLESITKRQSVPIAGNGGKPGIIK